MIIEIGFITGALQAAVCLYDPTALLSLRVAKCHFDHEGDSSLEGEGDRRAGLRETGAITNPSATSAPRTATWIYH